MLPSSHRLSASDVSNIMQNGRFAHTPLFSLRWIDSEGHSRIGAIVPSKVSKTAVGRNKLRRMMYIAIRKVYGHVVPNMKIAVLARNGALNQTQETIDGGIKEVFLRARLI